MTSRTLSVVAGLLGLLAIVEGAMLWQLHREHATASIELRASNAGLELGPEHGRVFVHPAERTDQLVAEGALEEEIAVAPGTYDVRVLFTRSKDNQSIWLDDVVLERGARATHTVEFGSGELSVEATVGSGAGEVVVYVFESGDQDRIITSMQPGQPVLIAPGTYDVRIVLTQAAEERAVRWRKGIPVQTGLQTRINVRFQQGALLVAALNGQQPLPDGAVELTVFRAGDLQREVVAFGLAGSPLRLAAGRYDIKATFSASNDKPVIWLEDLAITEDETLEKTVAFTSGTAVVSAKMEQGEALDDFQAYVYYYRVGDHQEPVAYAPAPEPVVLESGRYDVRVNHYRSHDRPDIWIRDLFVPPGGRVSRTAVFASGKLLVRAYDAAGTELVGDNIFVRVYAAGEDSRPIAVARSGEILVLTAGVYDLVAEDTRSPGTERRIQRVAVTPGKLSEHALTFGRP